MEIYFNFFSSKFYIIPNLNLNKLHNFNYVLVWYQNDWGKQCGYKIVLRQASNCGVPKCHENSCLRTWILFSLGHYPLTKGQRFGILISFLTYFCFIYFNFPVNIFFSVIYPPPQTLISLFYFEFVNHVLNYCLFFLSSFFVFNHCHDLPSVIMISRYYLSSSLFSLILLCSLLFSYKTDRVPPLKTTSVFFFFLFSFSP